MEAKLSEEKQEEEKVTPQYARARRRVIAYIPDFIIVLLLVAILMRVPGLREVPTLVYTSLYFGLFWAWRGQTPGKMLLGIKIVGQDGKSPGCLRALVRYVVGFCGLIAFFIFSMLTGSLLPGTIFVLVASFIILLSVAFDRHKRGIHDRLANTHVIRSR